MSAGLASDAHVVLHFAFIAFVVAGGLLTIWHRGWAFVHLPAVAWAAWTEFTGTVCPLTPWENALRAKAGDAAYAESFVEHYLVPIIYPSGLTPSAQLSLGLGVVALNAVVYGWSWRRSRCAPRFIHGTRRST